MNSYRTWWRDWKHNARAIKKYAPPVLLSEYLDIIGGLNVYLRDEDMDLVNTDCAIEQIWAMKEGIG